mmetsp:Transcript_1944/g.4549  ORF Transcript_1944/g.4549 Transcript_1944/m.4549 type:complete len:254 (+) Transcript_1944:524-1285(+)
MVQPHLRGVLQADTELFGALLRVAGGEDDPACGQVDQGDSKRGQVLPPDRRHPRCLPHPHEEQRPRLHGARQAQVLILWAQPAAHVPAARSAGGQVPRADDKRCAERLWHGVQHAGPDGRGREAAAQGAPPRQRCSRLVWRPRVPVGCHCGRQRRHVDHCGLRRHGRHQEARAQGRPGRAAAVSGVPWGPLRGCGQDADDQLHGQGGGEQERRVDRRQRRCRGLPAGHSGNLQPPEACQHRSRRHQRSGGSDQ